MENQKHSYAKNKTYTFKRISKAKEECTCCLAQREVKEQVSYITKY